MFKKIFLFIVFLFIPFQTFAYNSIEECYKKNNPTNTCLSDMASQLGNPGICEKMINNNIHRRGLCYLRVNEALKDPDVCQLMLERKEVFDEKHAKRCLLNLPIRWNQPQSILVAVSLVGLLVLGVYLIFKACKARRNNFLIYMVHPLLLFAVYLLLKPFPLGTHMGFMNGGIFCMLILDLFLLTVLPLYKAFEYWEEQKNRAKKAFSTSLWLAFLIIPLVAIGDLALTGILWDLMVNASVVHASLQGWLEFFLILGPIHFQFILFFIFWRRLKKFPKKKALKKKIGWALLGLIAAGVLYWLFLFILMARAISSWSV